MAIRMIGVAGPSGVGKSTMAYRAQQAWPELITLIQLDKFYKNANRFPMLGPWRNWEVPENLLWDELYCVLAELQAGRSVEVPLYSRPAGRRLGRRLVYPRRVILVEGFLLFYKQHIRDMFELKIYFKASFATQLQRRMQREPGFDPNYFEHIMKPAFERYGSSAEQVSDVVIKADREPEMVWREFRRNLDIAG